MSPGQAGDRVNVLCKLYRVPLKTTSLTQWVAGAVGPPQGTSSDRLPRWVASGIRHCDGSGGATLPLDAHTETKPGWDMESKFKVTVSHCRSGWEGTEKDSGS